jgi:hypothetical protein
MFLLSFSGLPRTYSINIIIDFFIKNIQNDAGKPGERTTDIQSSKYIHGWRLFLRQDLEAGSAAKSMAMGSPAGPDFSSYCGFPASIRRVGEWHPDIIKYRKQDLLFKKSAIHFALPAASPLAYLLE